MKNQIKNLLMLTAIAGSLTLVSCRETKEDDSSEHMENEMQDGEHMEGNNMMDDENMDEYPMENEKTSDLKK
ncbi:MAG: hypothetical protein ACQEWG_16990 [Bacteroidota bacterium]